MAGPSKSSKPTSLDPSALPKPPPYNHPPPYSALDPRKMAVPAHRSFELRWRMRDGSKQEALFATEDIKPGTRLICEKPAVAVTQTGETLDNIYTAYLTLSPSEQSSFWDLKPGPAPPHLHAEAAFIDSLIHVYMNLYTTSQSRALTPREDSVFDRLGPQIQHLCRAWRVAARFHHHRQCLLNIPLNQRYTIPPHVPVSGLFLTAARTTHSCVPNCFVAYNSQLHQLTMHATSEIKQGSMLTASIIGEKIWYESSATRAKLLRNAANIICLCSACGFDAHEPDQTKRKIAEATFDFHERERRNLYLNIVYLTSTLTQLLVVEHPVLITSSGFVLGDGNQTYEQLKQSFAAALPGREVDEANFKLEATLELLEEVGCRDLELVRWRNVQAAVLYEKKKKWGAGEESGKVALEIAERCVGKDGEEMAALRDAVRGIGRKRHEAGMGVMMGAMELKLQGLQKPV